MSKDQKKVVMNFGAGPGKLPEEVINFFFFQPTIKQEIH